MSRHEDVSCDFCSKNNFKGKRFKCLRCLDYDLCMACHSLSPDVTNHPADHPFQCIITQADYDLYYGGEALPKPQAFTCSVCGKLGFSETLLVEHVIMEHEEVSMEVVCPICVAMPFGEPHNLTDDFSGHLTREHGDTVFTDEFSIPTTSRGSRPTRSASSTVAYRYNYDPLSEILTQLARSRRSQPLRSQTEGSRVQARLFDTRQPRNGRGDQTEEDNPRGFKIPVIPPRKSPSKSCDANLSLLKSFKTSAWKKTQQEKEEAEESHAARSVFMQQIMISTLNDPNLNPSHPIDLKTFFNLSDPEADEPQPEKSS